MIATGAKMLPRRIAAARIADRLLDRTAYVIAAADHIADDATRAFADLAEVDVLLDNGTSVLSTTPTVAAVVTALLPGAATAVFLVPKSTPVDRLRAYVGDQLPADGSRDMVLLADPDDGLMYWPRLLVDAIALAEPATAAAVAAHDIRNLS